MLNSLVTEKLVGYYLLVMAVVMIKRRKELLDMIEAIRGNVIANFLGGIFALLFGLMVILTHPGWTLSTAVLVTIIGWIATFKGIALLLQPEAVWSLLPESRKKLEQFIRIDAPIMLALGIIVLLGAYL